VTLTRGTPCINTVPFLWKYQHTHRKYNVLWNIKTNKIITITLFTKYEHRYTILLYTSFHIHSSHQESASMASGECRLAKWRGGGSYKQTCILQYVHTVHSLSETACCESQTHTLAQTAITMTYHVWKQNITRCLWYLKPSHQAYCIHTSPIRHTLHAGNNQYIVYTKTEYKINANFTTYL